MGINQTHFVSGTSRQVNTNNDIAEIAGDKVLSSPQNFNLITRKKKIVNTNGTVKKNLKLEKVEKIKGIAAKNIFNSPISPIQK